MNLLKLALLQIAPGDSLEENLQKGLAVCREAKAKGADIALFPEMWSNGYRLHDRPVAQWQSEAIPVDGAFVSAFSDLAKELGMAICITLLEYFDPAPRNTAVLIDRFGKMQSIYAKVHTCDFDVERNLTPSDGFNAGGCDLATIPQAYRTATADPAFSTAWSMYRNWIIRGIPACFRRTKRRASI